MTEHPAHSRRNLEKPESGRMQEFVCRPPRFKIADDLILSATTMLQIDEALAKLRHHRTIYDEWNFAAIDPLGTGAILNFYGPPGTGKTMAGESIAGTLGLPFIHIGIAELESKFMGETAKNIQRAFQAAERDKAVILFDEADTLLGKRLSSVTQGIDNEVNSMRSTLLIELERFVGIAIFATNFASNYDEAFRSRITHHVRFDLPDANARRNLWEKMLLPTIPIREDRESIIAACVEQSDGFSGREIRTCMRLSLPKALLEAEQGGHAAALAIKHLTDAIAQIRKAHAEVATAIGGSGRPDVAVARSLLGIRNPEGES